MFWRNAIEHQGQGCKNKNCFINRTFFVSHGLSSFPSSSTFSSIGGTGYGNTAGQNKEQSKHL